MCFPQKTTQAAPPPPAAPPMALTQIAPRQADGASEVQKKRRGLKNYKLSPTAPPTAPSATTNKLGGIPKKTGV